MFAIRISIERSKAVSLLKFLYVRVGSSITDVRFVVRHLSLWFPGKVVLCHSGIFWVSLILLLNIKVTFGEVLSNQLV